MITYAGAADVLIGLARQPGATGDPVAAADPYPLALTEIAHAITERTGRRIAIMPVPSAAAALTGSLAPGIANRLFRSSVLDPGANILTPSGAYGVAGEMLAYLDRLAAARSAGQDRRT